MSVALTDCVPPVSTQQIVVYTDLGNDYASAMLSHKLIIRLSERARFTDNAVSPQRH